MKTSDVLPQFNNSVKDLADALGITREAIYQWNGQVPRLREYEIKDILARRGKVSPGDTPGEHREAA